MEDFCQTFPHVMNGVFDIWVITWKPLSSSGILVKFSSSFELTYGYFIALMLIHSLKKSMFSFLL